MGLQMIQDGRGKATGVYIPIAEWNRLKTENKNLRNWEVQEKEKVMSIAVAPSLSGNPLSNQEFINWLQQAEETSTISLKEAQKKWTNKRKQLQKLTK
ncbi:MAG: hypothetical protein LBE82_12070 [Chitinophagaceae bacterium]|jgi:hypothetical protein|nr:hypothetical protein [Chitinophagaceae bacterium]